MTRLPHAVNLVGFGRITGHRAIVVLLLFAAGFLLALPTMACAHIKRAHEGAFISTTVGFDQAHNSFVEVNRGMATSIQAIAAMEQPLIYSSDPDDQATLVGLESQATALWQADQTGDADSLQAQRHLATKVEALPHRARSWFTRADDRAKLKHACWLLHDAIEQDLQAYTYDMDALRLLGSATVPGAQSYLIQSQASLANAVAEGESASQVFHQLSE